MNCKKCNAIINDADIFCGTCGTKIEREETTSISTNNDQDEILLKAYIGKNYDKITNSKFSLPGFFLGAVYLFYRKMWLYSLGYILINLIGMLFLPSISSFISMLLYVYTGLEFNKIYVKAAKEKIKKIKEENYDKQPHQLEEICRKKGGTALVLTILIFTLYIVLFFILGIILSFHLINENKIQGEIADLKYEIPSLFEESTLNTDSLKMYSVIEEDEKCSIYINTSPSYYYENMEDYLDSYFYITDEYDKMDITTTTIEGEKWYTQTVPGDNSTYYYYAIEKNDYIYDINVSITRDNNDRCKEAQGEFLDSLEFN